MDVLAGRKNQGVLHGELTVNGHRKVQETWARVVGYVEQTDVHSGAPHSMLSTHSTSSQLRSSPHCCRRPAAMRVCIRCAWPCGVTFGVTCDGRRPRHSRGWIQGGSRAPPAAALRSCPHVCAACRRADGGREPAVQRGAAADAGRSGDDARGVRPRGDARHQPPRHQGQPRRRARRVGPLGRATPAPLHRRGARRQPQRRCTRPQPRECRSLTHPAACTPCNYFRCDSYPSRSSLVLTRGLEICLCRGIVCSPGRSKRWCAPRLCFLNQMHLRKGSCCQLATPVSTDRTRPPDRHRACNAAKGTHTSRCAAPWHCVLGGASKSLSLSTCLQVQPTARNCPAPPPSPPSPNCSTWHIIRV